MHMTAQQAVAGLAGIVRECLVRDRRTVSKMCLEPGLFRLRNANTCDGCAMKRVHQAPPAVPCCLGQTLDRRLGEQTWFYDTGPAGLPARHMRARAVFSRLHKPSSGRLSLKSWAVPTVGLGKRRVHAQVVSGLLQKQPLRCQWAGAHAVENAVMRYAEVRSEQVTLSIGFVHRRLSF